MLYFVLEHRKNLAGRGARWVVVGFSSPQISRVRGWLDRDKDGYHV
jgi:hypothetical protein